MNPKIAAILEEVETAIHPPMSLDDAIDFVTELRDELDMRLSALNFDKGNEEKNARS